MGADDLPGLIRAPETSRVYQYVGTVTWFWELALKHPEAGSYRVVVAALPPETDEAGPLVVIESLQVIEERD